MDDSDLVRNAANFAALTPLSFLTRAASVYPDKIAVIYRDRKFTYRLFYERCRRFANALNKRGIGAGDTVAIIAPNIPPLLEAHYGVPMAGAVLLALNNRLDANTIATFLAHSESKLLIVDREYNSVVVATGISSDKVIEIDDGVGAFSLDGSTDYEAFLAEADPEVPWRKPRDEWEPIALNYTSGTSGSPRGVVYHHRGAFLNATSNAILFGLNTGSPVYLWTLPMFHCNGWCFTWAVTAVAGTHVCLRRVEPATIFAAIADNHVTHLCGAPIILNLLVNAPVKHSFGYTVEVATGGAAPPAKIIEGMEELGFHVTHLYGLTESFGPSAICVEQDEWSELPLSERAVKMSRQGVPNLVPIENRVISDGVDVPADSETMGELVLRGNTIMRGYLKNPEATEQAFKDDWFHTGDLAVRHPDGYVEIKDRSKDIIIVGGDNVSSLEIEDALYRHREVLEAAVVAKPDPVFGEVPCAFITLKPGAEAHADPIKRDIIAHCRRTLASFKVPQDVIFGPLPKTATGKIQKFELRTRFKQPLQTILPLRSVTAGKLTMIWRSLLGDDTISVTDNFFDSGGDSFMALRLGTEIEKSFGRVLPLGVIFSLPTIQKLAEYIASTEPSDDELLAGRSVLPLRDGNGRPIFFVHWMLRSLARHLDGKRPIYNLSYELAARTATSQRRELPPSVEALATYYIAEMQRVQPRGPYTLIGHSAGGLVAYEMAQQLRTEGQDTDYLGLIDSTVVNDLFGRGERYPLHRQLVNCFQFTPRELYRKFHAFATGTSEYPWEVQDGSTIEFWKNYRPRPYNGDVTLFKATRLEGIRDARIPVERAWTALVDGTLRVHLVPGRHLSVIEEPYVYTLAAKLHHSIMTE